MTNYWKRLKSYPYLYHLVLIAGSRCRTAAGGALRHAARHAPRAAPHGARLHGSRTRRRGAAGAAQTASNCASTTRCSFRAYDGGVVLDQLPHEGTQVKGRPHGLCDDQLVLAEEGRGSLTWRGVRSGRPRICSKSPDWRSDRLVYQPDMATNYVLEQRVDGRPIEAGTKRQIEMGSGVTLYVGVAEGDSVVVVPKVIGGVAARGQKPPVGAGVQRRSGRLRRGDRPAEPEGCTCLRPAARAGICDGSGFEVGLRLTLDAEKVARESAASDKQAQALSEEQERRRAELRRFAGRGRGAPPCRGVAARRRDGERRGG